MNIKTYIKDCWKITGELIGKMNKPIWAVIITAFAYAIFLIIRINFCQSDLSCFILVGQRFADPINIPHQITTTSQYGYDGQFYYRLALNPFTYQPEEFGITFDGAPYRHQRILYPLTVWLLSFGNTNLVPILMILVNYAGLLLIAWLGAHYAIKVNRHAFWGIALSFAPGFIFSLSRNLTEITEVLLILCVLYSIRRQKWLLATLFLTLGIFARDTSLIVSLAILISNIISKFKIKLPWQQLKIPWYVWLTPIISYTGWHIFLHQLWGSGGLNTLTTVWGIPFIGYFQSLSKIVDVISPTLFWIETVFILLIFIVTALLIKKSHANLIEIVSWAGFALLISIIPLTWADGAIIRVAGDFIALSLIILMNLKSQWWKPIVFSSIFLWIYEFSVWAYSY